MWISMCVNLHQLPLDVLPVVVYVLVVLVYHLYVVLEHCSCEVAEWRSLLEVKAAQSTLEYAEQRVALHLFLQ